MKPPISDPFEAPNFDDLITQDFAVDIRQGFVAALPLAASILLVCWLILADIPGYGKFVFIVVTSFALLTSILISLFLMRIRVIKNGFRAPDVWGFSREIEWSQIKDARSRWLFCSYIVISTHQKRNAIWIPFFLRNPQGFARAVEEWAPADNPLRLFLQKRGF